MISLAQNSNSITRYIFSKSHFSNNGVKHNAFIPPKEYPNELSVCFITGMEEIQIWKYCPSRNYQQVKARSDLKVNDVENIYGQDDFLKVEHDGIPHKYHANIKSIPVDKSKRRAVATELANKSTLVIAP
ncbi:MAG: hypothetical protein HAW67_07295 [Endozoicomonadaceae bacterium]|nr:hypothetical protein [Endozoicomonadaceae bacterium]